MKTKLRVRLRFEMPPPLLVQTSISSFMFLINKEHCSSVYDVEKNICDKFGLSSPHSISLFINGFALISSDDVDVIRDDDEILVSINDDAKVLSSIELTAKDCPKINTQKAAKQPKRKKLTKKIKTSTPVENNCLKKHSETADPKKRKHKHKKKSKQKSKKKDRSESSPVGKVVATNMNGSEETKPVKSPSPAWDLSIFHINNDLTNDIDLSTPSKNASSPSKKARKVKDFPIDSPRKKTKINHEIGEKTSVDYEALVGLSWPPRSNDIIAFKLLEMAEDYTPIISNFKEARVIDVLGQNPESASLQLEMLSSEPLVVKRSGKFELDDDDDDDMGEYPTTIMWKRLVNPKLIK